MDGLISKGIFQWDEVYPTRSDFENDIKKGDLTCAIIDGKIACIYVINSDFDEAYNHADWLFPNANFRILHRIIVNPDFQDKGVGTQIMTRIIEELKVLGVESLRLDVFSENPISNHLYEKLGFIKTGEAHWRKGLFYLMERVL